MTPLPFDPKNLDISKLSDRVLADAYESAYSFLRGFRWCDAIGKCFLGEYVEGIVAVFLFEVSAKNPEVGDKVWIIVGDLPPAYIAIADAHSAIEALDGYIGAMEEWVSAVRAGTDVSELIPVSYPATSEYANSLEARLRFLDKHLVQPILGKI
jgi:hypothetical protein